MDQDAVYGDHEEMAPSCDVHNYITYETFRSVFKGDYTGVQITRTERQLRSSDPRMVLSVTGNKKKGIEDRKVQECNSEG
jgi:hypothetical protein